MSRKASNFQKVVMSWGYRGKEIFKPLNTGRIDDHVACVREWVANIFFYTKNKTTIMIQFTLPEPSAMNTLNIFILSLCEVYYILIIH